MAGTTAQPFAPRGTTAEIEAGVTFMPKFDAAGLIPAVVTDADTPKPCSARWRPPKRTFSAGREGGCGAKVKKAETL
jgi:hypothetical protein